MKFTIDTNGHTLSIDQFQTDLHTWGRIHQRVFPWRTGDNPFHILIAELMLRRTQARQVVPVYNQFIMRYPDARTLMDAISEEVAEILYPLGLAWRVPAFQQIARILVTEYDTQVPEDYKTLMTLPGIGDYVASAICSFAFQQAIPIIDTNTVRVAGRLFGIATHAESRRQKLFRHLLKDLLDEQDSQTYNYHLLDFAALICTPMNPHCSECPLLSHCKTGQEQNICLNG